MGKGRSLPIRAPVLMNPQWTAIDEAAALPDAPAALKCVVDDT